MEVEGLEEEEEEQRRRRRRVKRKEEEGEGGVDRWQRLCLAEGGKTGGGCSGCSGCVCV